MADIRRSTLADFQILKTLGSGSFGTVYLVRRLFDGREYVLKSIPISNLSKHERSAAVNECQLLSRVHSRYVVRYYDSFLCPQTGTINLIQQYAAHGDLASYLKTHQLPLPEDTIWRFLVQMTIGLAELHRARILHRDLKTLNIFLDENDNVLVGDLGVSRLLDTYSFAETMVGTPYYLSPELVEEQPYGRASDIWALGCILYELCTGTKPFSASNHGALIFKILRGQYAPIDESYSSRLRQLVSVCLAHNPEDRPTAVQILHFPVVLRQARHCEIVYPDWIQDLTAKKRDRDTMRSTPSLSPLQTPRAANSEVVSVPEAPQGIDTREMQEELDTLIQEIQTTKNERHRLLGQILKQISDQNYQEIRKFIEEKGDSVAEDTMTKFVLGRISLRQIEVVDWIRDLISLDKKSRELAQKVSEVTKRISPQKQICHSRQLMEAARSSIFVDTAENELAALERREQQMMEAGVEQIIQQRDTALRQIEAIKREIGDLQTRLDQLAEVVNQRSIAIENASSSAIEQIRAQTTKRMAEHRQSVQALLLSVAEIP